MGYLLCASWLVVAALMAVGYGMRLVYVIRQLLGGPRCR